MGARERLAGALHDAGALRAVMRLRQYSPVPTTLSVLTYHHVAEEAANYPFDRGVADATPAQFRRQLELIARYGTPVTIDDLIRALDGDSLPRNAVMITFDDGYRSCHDTALPILKQIGLPATFFIPTSFVGERKLFWWERIALILSGATRPTATISYPAPHTIDAKDPGAQGLLSDVVKDTPQLDLERFLDGLGTAFGVAWNADVERGHANELVMTWDHVRALAKAGMDVESHSKSHRVLQTLSADELADDLGGSKQVLERELGRPVRAIAYPVGRRIAHVPEIRRAVDAAGYRLGFTNATGATRIWPGRLGRLIPTDRFDVARLSTDRMMSDAMYFAQIAVPRLAYLGA